MQVGVHLMLFFQNADKYDFGFTNCLAPDAAVDIFVNIKGETLACSTCRIADAAWWAH